MIEYFVDVIVGSIVPAGGLCTAKQREAVHKRKPQEPNGVDLSRLRFESPRQ